MSTPWDNDPIISNTEQPSSAAPWASDPIVENASEQDAGDMPRDLDTGEQGRRLGGEDAMGVSKTDDEGVEAGDFGLEVLEGGVSGVGSAIGGTGDFLSFGGDLVESGLRKLGLGDVIDAGDRALGNRAPSDAFQVFEKWMQEGGEEIDAKQAETFRKTMKASTPDGDLFKPGTWSFGDDPSVTGYAAQMAGLIGQFAPQAATMLAGSPQRAATAMTLMGGAQAGGSQADEAEKRVLEMREQELSDSSGLYRDLREGGLSHREAQGQTAKAAGAAAFQGAAPTGAAGGALTSYVLGPLQAKLGGSIAGRMVDSVGLQGGGEALQEVSETMLARANTNRAINGSQDISEGTFGDAVLGGAFGAGLGAAGVVGGGRDATPARTPNDAVRERTPEDRAALSEAFDQERGSDTTGSGDTRNPGQMPPTPEWEAAWQARGVEDPYANLPDTTIDIERAAADTDTSPTPAQAEAGNYRKGRVRLNGFEIAIENPKGSTRSGTDDAGNAWENRMGGHYGDIKGTEGADGDNLDVFLGDNPASPRVFVVDQVAEDGSFDETKTLMGYDSLEDAQQAYLSSYEEEWQGIGEITETTMSDFRQWVREGNTRAPFAMPQDTPSADAEATQGDNLGDTQGADDSAAQKRKETTFLPDNTPVETEFRVVDLADLTPSNRADGQINPAFPAELQPRDRTNANSQVQVNNIAARLNPERLGSSPDAGTGAPIIGNDGVVESGNGRTMAIASAYKQGGQRAQQYRDYVQKQARERGIEANTDGMRRPVLVRERTTDMDRAEFARRSNESQVAGMTSYEQAMADADTLSADDLAAWSPDQSGDPLAASNRDFQRGFVSRLGNNEAARYTTRRGQAAPELGQRMSRAVFAKAYDAPDMVEMVTEQGDQMRNLAGALQTAAPDFAMSRETGNQEAAETIETVNEAVRLVRASRREGVSIRELTEQTDAFSEPVSPMTSDLAMLINTNMRSRATLENALSYVASDTRRRAETALNGALFEDTTTSEDAIREGFKQNAEVEGGAPGGLEADVSGRVSESEREPAGRREAGDTQGAAEAEAVTLRPDGAPFQTKRAAELSKTYRETPGAVAVEADGGWGFTVPAEDAAPLLETYTEQDLAQREQETARAEQDEADQARQEAERAQADKDADDFLLTGSDNAADVAAARGQDPLFAFAGERAEGTPSPGSTEGEADSASQAPRADNIAEAIRGVPELGDATVIQSHRDLPPDALMGMALQGVNPRDVRGMYIGGELYVIADNVDTVEEGVRTAVHEAVGHKGIRGVLGEELEPVMRQLYRRLPHSRIGRQARDEVLRDYPFLDSNNSADQVSIAEEMVAHLIEKGHRPAAWQRAVAKIKELLRKLFPLIPWTTTDVLEMGEKARDYLRRRQAGADDGRPDDMTFAMRRRADTSRVSDEFRDLDTNQAEALDMIGPLGVTGSALVKVRDVMDRSAVKFRAGLFDKYAALKELDEKALGRDFIESSTASSSWILARMAPAAQGALHTLIHNGRIRLDPEQKVLEMSEESSPGLAGVLAQLGDAAEVTRFMGWIAGNRAEKLAEQGRENYFEPRHIAGLMELNSGRTKEGKARRTLYAEVFEEFQQYRDDVLAIAEQAGLLKKAMSEPEADLIIARKYGAPEAIINRLRHEGDALAKAEDGDLLDRAEARYAMAHQELTRWLAESVEKAQGDALDPASQRLDAIMQELESLQRDQREMWAEEFYVPFYRVLDENTNDVQGPASTAGLTRQRAYQRLKGADMRIGDLLENTLMNYHHLLSASMKNLAAVQAIENAEQVEIAREVPESDRDPKTSTFILRDGQQVFYEISDDLVYKALVNMTDAGMSALMNSSSLKTMRWFKRLLTNMVTVTLEFVAANTIRDSLQSAAVTPAGMNPVWNAVRGAGYYANKKNRAQMIASGGSFNFGHLYGNRGDELKAQLKRNLRDSSVISDPASALKAAKWSWRRWNDITEFAENINRAKVYQSNLDRGKLYAAFQSRDLMDFSSHGSWFMTRFLIDTVPFLNARLQGLDKLYRDGFKPTLLTAFGQGGKSDKVRAKRFSIVTGALMVASIGLYLNNQDDEDYQALEEWQKDTYWFFKFGGHAFFTPKPFEVGAIATMAERMTQQFADDAAGGDLFKERLWHMLTQTFAFSPVPQMAAPVLDVYANRDPFRDRPIESYWDQVLSPSLRFRSNTTMQMRYLSRGVENTVGDESFLSLSPKQLDYLFNGYLGSVGSYAAGMVDTMIRRAKGIESPSSKWTESKPIRRFYRNLATPAYYTRYQTLFYEGLREADRVYADVKKLEKMGAIEEARERAKNKGDLLRLRKQLNDARSDLSDISKAMDHIKKSVDMDPEYKRRELERLRTVRNRITEVLGKEVEGLNAD